MTPCTPDTPMQPIIDRLEAGDFEAALDVFRQAEREGRLDRYRPRPGDLLDSRDLKRDGEIQPGQRTYRGIRLEWTQNTVSRARPWFQCPSCGHRVAILFDRACRRCAGMRYRSQYEPRLDRLRVKASKLRQSLRDYGGLFDLAPTRPHRMTRRRYAQLLDELEQIELEAAHELNAEGGFVERIIERFRVAREVSSLLDRQRRRRRHTRHARQPMTSQHREET